MPALADVTARYAAGKDVVTVEVADSGNWRVDYPGSFSIIRRDGVDYIALLFGPAPKVARLDEVMAATGAGRGAEPPVPPMLRDMKLTVTANGEAVIAGRKALLWNLVPVVPSEAASPKDILEVAVSADPELAPVGAVFRHVAEVLLPLFGPLLPESGFAERVRELLAKGTPLRAGKKFELQSLDSAIIDPKRFDLPAPPVSAAEFMGESGMSVTGTDIAPLP
ncbi:MAG: hypothetical protein EOP61_05280 [Sphingomonadales bacterium]|nr:MAG: hypothetical protein EOP61_05280 [Sphingomonadales bacterium]